MGSLVACLILDAVVFGLWFFFKKIYNGILCLAYYIIFYLILSYFHIEFFFGAVQSTNFFPLRVKKSQHRPTSSNYEEPPFEIAMSSSSPPSPPPPPHPSNSTAVQIQPEPEDPAGLSHKVVNENLVSGFAKARKNQSLPMSFEFTNLSVSLPKGKAILQSVSGTIRPV
jgi:hypothetical protein